MIRSSKWSKAPYPKLILMPAKVLYSMGDVLRELDAKQILTTDFLLLSADTILNINVSSLIKEYRYFFY
jgi:translation initiation factor eIF-2B subunit epsilon